MPKIIFIGGVKKCLDRSTGQCVQTKPDPDCTMLHETRWKCENHIFRFLYITSALRVLDVITEEKNRYSLPRWESPVTRMIHTGLGVCVLQARYDG